MRLSQRRPGWLRYALLAVLVAGSGAGGLYLATQEAEDTPGQPRIGIAPRVKRQRFPLTALDAKDTVEAPALAIDVASRVYLVWASKTGPAERTVFLTRSGGEGKAFESPLAINRAGVYLSGAPGGKGGHERRATPILAADGATLQLAWTEALPDGKRMQLVHTASSDGGETFAPKQPVASDPRANATFFAMTLGPHGMLACSWLDDRTGRQQPYVALRPSEQAAFVAEQALPAGEEGKGVCPCCATAVCVAPDGTLFVAFRNIQDGYRDIFLARRLPGQTTFEEPIPLSPPTWKFKGCPHDGPSLAVVGDQLHVVWMDAHTGLARCYHAFASRTELKFTTKPLHVEGPGTQGNARILADRTGGLHAVWEESLGVEKERVGHQHGPPQLNAGGGRAIQYAYLAPGQKSFGAVQAIASREGAVQSRPALAVSATGEVWMAWNEWDETGKCVVATPLFEKSHHE